MMDMSEKTSKGARVGGGVEEGWAKILNLTASNLYIKNKVGGRSLSTD